MSKELNRLYKSEQFQYFRNKGFSLFLLEKESNWGVSKKLYIAKDASSIKGESFNKLRELHTEKELFENIDFYSQIYLEEESSKEFLLYFLSKYPKLKKQTLSSYGLNSIYTDQIYKQVIELETYKDIKDFIKKFNNVFTTKEFRITTDSFENIHSYLSKTWREDDVYLFWLDFFKQRKSSLKATAHGPKVAEFLINLYLEENLRAFFPFFPYLHSKFEELTPDIFEEKTKYIDYIPINYKKIGNVFNIKGFKREKYSNHLLALISAIIDKHEGIELFEHVGKNKSAGTYHLTFYHNNDNLNMEYIKNHIISYFTYLKNNPQEDPSDEFIKKWLEAKDLDNQLKKSNNTIKKNINKV